MAKIQKIAIEFIIPSGLNLRDVTDGSDLVQSLMARGLDIPLKVWKISEDTFKVLCGHRRLDGLKKLHELYPENFAAYFAKGVPCEVHENLTEEQALDIIADHGDIQALSSNMEFYRLAKAKWAFKPTFTEKQILSFIGSAMSKALTGNALIEVKAMSEQINKAASVMDKAQLMIKRDERLFAACKGKLQTWNAVRRLPILAEKLLEYSYTGVKPEGVDESLLVKIGQPQTDAMFKAWNELPADQRNDEKFADIVRNVKALVKAKVEEREQKKADKANVEKAVAENTAAYYLKVCNWIAEHHKSVYDEACTAVFNETNGK